MKFSVKIPILLVTSLSLLWFSEQFSPALVFEPQSIGWSLWVSYAKDLIQPFAFYFFIGVFISSWRRRALVAFAIPTLMELAQPFYQRFAALHAYIGSFDPLDVVMYALGVGLAVLVEQGSLVCLDFWNKQAPA